MATFLSANVVRQAPPEGGATTRRKLLGGTAALVGAGALGAGPSLASATPAPAFAAVAAPVAEGADADLMRLGAAFQRLQRRFLELTVPYFDVVEIPDEVHAENCSLAPVMHGLAEQMAGMHAVTAAGLRMKANVLLFYTGYLLDGRPDWDRHNELIGWSIARDLLGDEAARPQEELPSSPSSWAA